MKPLSLFVLWSWLAKEHQFVCGSRWVDNLIFSVIHFGQTLLPDTTRGNVASAPSSSLAGRLQDPVSTISLGTSTAVTVTHHYGRRPRHRSSRVESAEDEEVVVEAKGGKGNIIIGKVMSPKWNDENKHINKYKITG